MKQRDGLADEQGPIPRFGPARTEEHGRVIMTDEEWEAGRDAALRALRTVEETTDETDTNGIWDEVFRGLEGARRSARSDGTSPPPDRLRTPPPHASNPLHPAPRHARHPRHHAHPSHKPTGSHRPGSPHARNPFLYN